MASGFAGTFGRVKQEEPLRIAIVGIGALGCALLPRVMRLRVAGITLIDGDRVEGGNLERQDLYAEVDIGHFKAGTARGWLQMGAPGIAITAIDRFVDASNAEELLAGHSIVADCTDDLHAKALLDRICADEGMALVSGALHRNQGQVLVLHARGTNESVSRSDVFSGRIGADLDGCDMRRVPMEAIEAVAGRMALRIRELARGEDATNAVLEVFDMRSGAWSQFETRSR